MIEAMIQKAKEMKLVKPGQKVAVIHGTQEDTPDESNIMKILDVWKYIKTAIIKNNGMNK